MLLVLPLGSGGGISSSGYMCIWLSLPFFFHVLLQIEAREIKFLSYFNLKFPKFIFIHIAVLFSILFLSAKGYHLSKQAYFDYGSRLKKTHTINSRFTKYIYTKKRRARIVNDLLSELNKWVEPKDYLLVYDKVPMIHFLTDTKPYLYNPWVWIYDSQTFGNKLNKAESEISIYPIIVQQKMETIYAFSEPIENYMTSKKEEVTLQFNGYDAERNRLMTNFIDRNNYEIVWSNDYFNIYKTEKYNNTFSK
jgi:hypothetical protein